ncbi:MAG TPA: transporter substrate-binding domain-containing protein [Burkholderiaceae bacterium]|nr:transporter substrate-binding domain-containing protein [Burkholderiaceae bacterium]
MSVMTKLFNQWKQFTRPARLSCASTLTPPLRLLLWFLLIAATLLPVSSPVLAVQLRTAAQDASTPKFITQNLNGKSQIGGLCIDIMRAIERVDPGIKFVGDQEWQPRARIDNGLMTGNIDVICGIPRVKNEDKNYDFIQTPLFSVNYMLAVRADDTVQVSGWDDIRKLGNDGIVLAIHGFGIVEMMEGQGGLRIDAGAHTSQANLEKLLAHRGRFYIHRSPGIKAEIRLAGLEKQLKVLPVQIAKQEFYMATSKKLAANDFRKLSAALAQLGKRGELVSLFAKYQDESQP